MTSIADIEPLLASSMRILRNQTTLQDLIFAYPSLKEKSLSSPSTLTESERHMFLDLPDLDMEFANSNAATSLSRSELIEKAVTDHGGLTDSEVLVLKNQFWTPLTSGEISKLLDGFEKTSEEVGDKFLAIRTPAYLQNDKEAFEIGDHEF